MHKIQILLLFILLLIFLKKALDFLSGLWYYTIRKGKEKKKEVTKMLRTTREAIQNLIDNHTVIEVNYASDTPINRRVYGVCKETIERYAITEEWAERWMDGYEPYNAHWMRVIGWKE